MNYVASVRAEQFILLCHAVHIGRPKIFYILFVVGKMLFVLRSKMEGYT